MPLKDPFFEITPIEGTFNLDNLMAWYITKNPNFVAVNTLEIQVPEFRHITAMIVKDLLILKKTKSFPSKNEKNTNPGNGVLFHLNYNDFVDGYINTILLLIDVFLVKHLYINFLDILQHHISLFSIGSLYDESNNLCDNITLLNNLKETAYIIFPTTYQLTYYKSIYTMQAPVINFRLANVRKLIHHRFQPPSYEIYHDLDFHSELTHLSGSNSHISNNYTKIIKKSKLGDSLKQIFDKSNATIQYIKPHIIYKNTQRDQSDINYDKKILAYMIFYATHEIGNLKNLESIQSLYTGIFKLKHNVSDAIVYEEDILPVATYVYKKYNKRATSLPPKPIVPNLTDDVAKYLITYVLDLLDQLRLGQKPGQNGGKYKTKTNKKIKKTKLPGKMKTSIVKKL